MERIVIQKNGGRETAGIPRSMQAEVIRRAREGAYVSVWKTMQEIMMECYINELEKKVKSWARNCITHIVIRES